MYLIFSCCETYPLAEPLQTQIETVLSTRAEVPKTYNYPLQMTEATERWERSAK